MIENLRAELERLKERQAQLHHGMDLLTVHIRALEKRIAEAEAAVIEKHQKDAELQSNVPSAVPPVLPVAEQLKPEMVAEEQPVASSLLSARKEVRPHLETGIKDAVAPPPLLPEVVSPAAAGEDSSKPDSFEMRLGTYWLVRIGIVAMLTALVFFGTYAYQNYIGKLGPAGKVTLLYIASGALLGFGAWFQRRSAKESLKNYAQVLLAGGMAAVYFTTYAAHYFPNLQVIESAVLDGALLLAWAGFMAWVADRKKSEVLALFAVALAYYTSVITRVGSFTLYSNLVLAAAAVFFLIRNRWATLSFASVVATYASYGFWRFYPEQSWWQWEGLQSELWPGLYFLVAYWVVFAAAAFLSKHEKFVGVKRASFITLNNAAFYAMCLLTILKVGEGSFWQFNLISGAVLLAASVLARLRMRNEPLAANTYLTQGLLLVTIGIIAKFSGFQLALALALESVLLCMTGILLRNIVMRTGACVSAALASLWALDGIEPNDTAGAWLAGGVGGLFLFNALWSHWKEQGKSPNLLRATPTYFSALALVIGSVAIWQNVDTTHQPATYAVMALACVAVTHLTRLRELGLLAQLLFPGSAVLFIANLQSPFSVEPWWVFACVSSAALAMVQWWQRQKVAQLGAQARQVGQFMMAIVFAGVTGFWLEPLCNTQGWLLTACGLVLAMTAYGMVTRNGVIALVGQGYAMAAVISFFLHAGSGNMASWAALVPVVTLSVLALGGRRWAEFRTSDLTVGTQVRTVARWYGRLAMALVAWWTFQYAGKHELVWSFTAIGAVAFVVFGWLRNRDWLVFSLALNVCALLALVQQLVSETAVYWPNFVSVLVWMIEQQVARRQPERFTVRAWTHNVTMVLAGLALWGLVSGWVRQGFSGFYLTASWSIYAFAIFALGISLRERIYRWLGLGVLGAALGRVIIFDVWKLDTLYRILSFFALGLVLLVLGFIYNKYQERIRQWL